MEELAAGAVEAELQEQPPEEDEEDQSSPESWDEIGTYEQDEIKNDWMEKTAEEFLESEITNWHESGSALDDAKDQLAYKGPDEQYVMDALGELVEERAEEEETKIPFSNSQLIEAMNFEYETGYEGGKDVEITWDDSKLTQPEGWFEHPTFPGIEPIEPSSKLTSEMREAIEATIVKAFNEEAEKNASDIEPPNYLKENIGEYQDSYWDNMTDKDKFNWAKDNDHIEEAEQTAWQVLESLTKLPDQFDPLGEERSPKDYKLTKLLATHMSMERAIDVLRERKIFEKRSDAARAANTFENRLWSAWKGDSASTDGLILQAATAEELGGRWRSPTAKPEFEVPEIFVNASGKYAIAGKTAELTGKQFETKGEAEKHLESWLKEQPVESASISSSTKKQQEDANNRFAYAGGWEGVKAYVRAKWETSQYLLDKAKISEVDVYRAVLLKDKGEEEKVPIVTPLGNIDRYVTKLPDVELERNGAQSATVDPRVANDWGGVGAQAAGFNREEDRVVLRVRAPRTAVLGLPAYGKNIHGEREVVLAGTAWRKWDAWHKKAPKFEEVPV